MPKAQRTRAEWGQVRRQYLESLRSRGTRLTLRGQTWAVTEQGESVVLPGGMAATNNANQWWLDYDVEGFHQRHAIGAILLCAESDDSLHDFGLPADLVNQLEKQLPQNSQRARRSFNVFRHGDRFELKLTAGEALDITRRRGDVSWLRGGAPEGAAMVAEAPASRASLGREAPPVERRFFARLVRGGLQPLDPTDLSEGALYLVQVRQMAAVPSSRALRRIVARGGPADLPADFAEQHDHYAHGAAKR